MLTLTLWEYYKVPNPETLRMTYVWTTSSMNPCAGNVSNGLKRGRKTIQIIIANTGRNIPASFRQIIPGLAKENLQIHLKLGLDLSPNILLLILHM